MCCGLHSVVGNMEIYFKVVLTIWIAIVLLLLLSSAHWARFVLKHARVTAFVTAVIDQFPFFTLVERHLTARAVSATSFVFQELANGLEICGIEIRLMRLLTII